MNSIRLSLAAAALAISASPAFAHDCSQRVDDFERLLDTAADHAISASSGGQGVAGARQAQSMQNTEEALEDPVPYQEESEEAAKVEEADDAGEGGDQIIKARAALQNARELAESGDEDACVEALDEVILTLVRD